jgi:predicted GIY-YIG superfamily endonuclease
MRRKTFRKLKSIGESANHHHVYVILLAPEARGIRGMRAANPKCDPKKPCVYVGMTGLDPEKRFENHQKGIKAAAVVKSYGIRLLPELYAHLNPMPYDAAVQMEQDLAEDLRANGYTVAGGH